MASVYDEIGGGDAVTAAVDQFYVRVLGDPELAPYFEHTDMRKQKSHMRAFLAAALGGPQLYAGPRHARRPRARRRHRRRVRPRRRAPRARRWRA
jgi:hemoglobin